MPREHSLTVEQGGCAPATEAAVSVAAVLHQLGRQAGLEVHVVAEGSPHAVRAVRRVAGNVQAHGHDCRLLALIQA